MDDPAPVAPTVNSATITEVATQINGYIALCRTKAAGGLTLAELGELLLRTVQLAIRLAQMMPSDGAAKRALVLEAAAKAFDSLADRVVPVYLLPAWWLIKPAVRAALLAAISGQIKVGDDTERVGMLEVLLRSAPGPKWGGIQG